MIHSRIASRLAAVIVVCTMAACSPSTPAPAAPAAPPTPAMPAHWTVVGDEVFAPADIAPVAARLGGQVTALRNTTYDVGGKKVKLNTIVAAGAKDADAIMSALGKMKSDEWFVRDGLTIYEFVGANDVQSEMRAAKALLPGN